MRNVKIEKTTIIGKDVSIADGCYVGHNVVITGETHIGPNVTIGHGAVIGAPPEHNKSVRDFKEPGGTVLIYRGTIIREFVTIHQPMDDLTTIGEDCFIMCHSHVGHDARVRDNVVLSPYAMIGGHARVLHDAYVGMGAMLHQHTTIGAYAMVGMGAVVVKDVMPFHKVAGNPARLLGVNDVGMRRNGFSRDQINMALDEPTMCFPKILAEYEAFWDARNEDRGVVEKYNNDRE